jgi:Transglutaminase-like superfamily
VPRVVVETTLIPRFLSYNHIKRLVAMLKTVLFLLIFSMIAMMLKCLPFIFNDPLQYRNNFPIILPPTTASFVERDSKRQSTVRPSVSFQQNASTHLGCSCRSNQTHVVWPEKSRESFNGGCTCTWQAIQEAKHDAYLYLQQNIMQFDRPFFCTLGFHDDNRSSDIDGLSNGLIGPVINLSFQAKIEFAYTDNVPRPIFMEYILNYANLNEGRSNIRSLLWEKLVRPLFLASDEIVKNLTVAHVVRTINTKMWTLLAPSHTDCITFVSGQTPLIFDPMSVLSFGYGSCTGLSILFVHALRSAGIPARIAGTAAWNQNMENGNHNWVEIWLPDNVIHSHTSTYSGGFDCRGSWLFIEASANQTVVDNIDEWNPCHRWFCSPSRMENGTQFYAAKLERVTNDVHFPLAWDSRNVDVPAVNRTSYYQSLCAKCQ